MIMNKTQILYPESKETQGIHSYYKKESDKMSEKGFIIGVDNDIYDGIENYILRGFFSQVKSVLNKNRTLNWLNSYNSFNKTLCMSEFLNVIKPWTFPTVIIPELEESAILKGMEELGCDRVFIKNDYRSLFALSEYASVYPDSKIETIIKNFKAQNLSGPFMIRKFINEPEIFYNEQRIWVLNGNPHSPYPFKEFVSEAAKKVYEFSGSKYFTLDIAGDYIVEVNPGETSDRGGDNPLDWFCEIFANEFLR